MFKIENKIDVVRFGTENGTDKHGNPCLLETARCWIKGEYKIIRAARWTTLIKKLYKLAGSI